MLQSINLRMYPDGLNTSKTFWSSKNLVHTFFLSFNPAAAWRLQGDKTLRERTKKIGLNTKHSIFHDRTQSSICQYCDCLVMLCHSLYKKKNWKDFKVNFFLVQEVFSSKKEASTYKFLHCSTALYIVLFKMYFLGSKLDNSTYMNFKSTKSQVWRLLSIRSYL